MDTITLDDVRQLAGPRPATGTSIYLPTYPAGAAGLQDAIRLKNLLQRAEDQLAESGMRRCDAKQFLAPAHELPVQTEFWGNRSRGLAIFLAPGLFSAYRFATALPESVTVRSRLNIKPLLTVADRGERCLVLVLGQKHVVLWEVTRSRVVEVPVQGLPENKRAALNYDEVDRGEQVHSAMRGSLGKQAAVFHGQGGMPDTAKSELEQFFRAIDRALIPVLRQESAPLLLAGVDYELPIFRRINSYPHLVERHLTGNCELLTGPQLHARAWEVMRPYFDRRRRQALARLRELGDKDKTSTDVVQIVAAAASGKIDTLLVDPHREQPGVFDAASGRAIMHDQATADSDDLVNLAVAETLLHSGRVFAAESHELPATGPLAAIFRY